MKFLTPGSSATTLAWSGAWGRRLLSLMWGPIFLKGTLRWYWWCLSVSLASPWAWGIGSLLFSSPNRVWYTSRWLSADAWMKMVWLSFSPGAEVGVGEMLFLSEPLGPYRPSTAC